MVVVLRKPGNVESISKEGQEIHDNIDGEDVPEEGISVVDVHVDDFGLGRVSITLIRREGSEDLARIRKWIRVSFLGMLTTFSTL